MIGDIIIIGVLVFLYTYNSFLRYEVNLSYETFKSLFTNAILYSNKD